ncbi:MAG: UDP-N-acetylmuramoyl-tripeptide--D-alanyl-D-alanine ligase [Oscillospiraceae bacterium]|jgi:UDP-N-acetylmuramoyl-tripeptide--D-alanyl-D-alanine ligase|nr:UDP-N-acetylmuramoyl-tripeptide--D-alanyl-D-alanine ligase [Oscillospiraceae bacterium]
MEKINLKALVASLEVSVDGIIPEDMLLEQIITDTREAEVLDGLFVALCGENFDGHDFVEEAVRKGARVVLVSKFVELPAGVIVLRTEDMIKTLMQIVSYYRKLLNVLVIGVTGTAGKTSTKEMIATVLEQKFKVYRTEKNQNNEIGVFKSILSLTREHEVAVIELAMYDLGEIATLALAVKPDIAVITRIGLTCLPTLKTRGNIFKAKMEITCGLAKGGLLVLNGDDDYLKEVKSTDSFTVAFCGLESCDCEVFAKKISQNGVDGCSFTASVAGKELEVYIPAAGNHYVMNALMAIAIAKQLELTPTQIKNGLVNYKPVGARQQVVTKDGVAYVLDYYNANPDSVAAALHVLAGVNGANPPARKVFVFGDMAELGEITEAAHKKVGELAAKNAITLLCVGNAARFAYENAMKHGLQDAFYFETKEKLAESLPAFAAPNAIVWIKGSRFMQLEQILPFFADY